MEAHCAYCSTPLNGSETCACQRCGTMMHADCKREYDRCAIYGCEKDNCVDNTKGLEDKILKTETQNETIDGRLTVTLGTIGSAIAYGLWGFSGIGSLALLGGWAIGCLAGFGIEVSYQGPGHKKQNQPLIYRQERESIEKRTLQIEQERTRYIL